MANPRIGFILGSKSDLPLLEKAEGLLKEMSVPYEVRIISAHRTPERARQYCLSARDRGLEVLIGVAGMAAHLAGALAAHCDLPILGVPAPGSALQGMDALLSTVQMPAGVPVATFAIGKAGVTNAALFACQIIGTADENVRKQVAGFRAAQTANVQALDDETKGVRS